MNIEKLKELRDAITDGRFEFDMAKPSKASCNTPGCVAGTALALWPQAIEHAFGGTTYDKKKFAKFFGVSGAQAEAIICPLGQGQPITKLPDTIKYDMLTREVAVAMLNRLIATGEVNWEQALLTVAMRKTAAFKAVEWSYNDRYNKD